ncbi:MAG: hypothetical protein JW828_12975 [Sedimentisphaerales bacterium]|nr:hypothetical protein [Sedimentisphaerales bacterium]
MAATLLRVEGEAAERLLAVEGGCVMGSAMSRVVRVTADVKAREVRFAGVRLDDETDMPDVVSAMERLDSALVAWFPAVVSWVVVRGKRTRLDVAEAPETDEPGAASRIGEAMELLEMPEREGNVCVVAGAAALTLLRLAESLRVNAEWVLL